MLIITENLARYGGYALAGYTGGRLLGGLGSIYLDIDDPLRNSYLGGLGGAVLGLYVAHRSPISKLPTNLEKIKK